jgi:hypothetical protein
MMILPLNLGNNVSSFDLPCPNQALQDPSGEIITTCAVRKFCA